MSSSMRVRSGLRIAHDIGARRQRLRQRHRNAGLVAFKDLRTAEVSAIGTASSVSVFREQSSPAWQYW